MKDLGRPFAIASLVWLAAASGALAQPQGGRQGDNHTNPPIIISKGSVLWYKASSERPNKCHEQADPNKWCDKKASAYPICKEAYGKGWCVKQLKGTYDVIDNATGECTVNRYALETAFVDDGTDWAEEIDTKGNAKGHQLELHGHDPADGMPITLLFVVGDEQNRNTWEFRKGGKRCILDDSGSAIGGIPREFEGLTTIKLGPDEKHSVAWAACLKKDCKH